MYRMLVVYAHTWYCVANHIEYGIRNTLYLGWPISDNCI